MNYFKQNGNMVEKYEINYEREVIENFKVRVINECSEIIHQEIDSTVGPDRSDYLKIRNYHQGSKVGVREYTDGPDEYIYHFSYDEYKFPYLVSLIDKFLNGDMYALKSIFNPDFKMESVSINTRIEMTMSELEEINNLDFDKKREKLDELKKLIEISNINKDQKPIADYYNKFKDLVSLNLVDTISIDEISKITSFFDIANNLQKTMKK